MILKIHFLDPRDFKVYPRGHNEVRTLINLGYNVRVIAFDWNRKYPKEEIIFNKCTIIRIYPTIWFDHQSKLSILNVFILFYYIMKKLLKEKPKILHSHGLLPTLCAAIYKILINKKLKLIYDIREDFIYNHKKQLEIRSFSKVLQNFVGKLTECIENIVVKIADHNFVVSTVDEYLYKRISNLNYRTSIVNNFPSKESTIDKKLQNRLIDQIGKRIPIFYSGGISKNRGIFEMLEVTNILCKLNYNPVLLLVGEITDNHNEIYKYIEKENLSKSVLFFGKVPTEYINTYLSVSRIAFELYKPTPYHLKSRASSKLFIYMRSGTPIVISDFPGIGSIVKENNCGICVDPNNIEDITNAVIRILNDKILYKKLSENGFNAVKKKYNWEIEELKIINAYKEMMNEK